MNIHLITNVYSDTNKDNTENRQSPLKLLHATQVEVNSWRDSHPFRGNNLNCMAFVLVKMIECHHINRRWMSQERMASLCMRVMSRKTFNLAIRMLRELGYIDVYSRGFKKTRLYVLNPILQQCRAVIENGIFYFKDALFLNILFCPVIHRSADSESFVTLNSWFSNKVIFKLGELMFLRGGNNPKKWCNFERDMFEDRFSDPWY